MAWALKVGVVGSKKVVNGKHNKRGTGEFRTDETEWGEAKNHGKGLSGATVVSIFAGRSLASNMETFPTALHGPEPRVLIVSAFWKYSLSFLAMQPLAVLESQSSSGSSLTPTMSGVLNPPYRNLPDYTPGVHFQNENASDVIPGARMRPLIDAPVQYTSYVAVSETIEDTPPLYTPYQSEETNELSLLTLKKGDVVKIVQRFSGDYWLGATLTGEEGFFKLDERLVSIISEHNQI